MNPFNEQPYSAQYREILRNRKELPVFVQMAEVYDMASNPPLIVLRHQVLTIVHEVYEKPNYDNSW